MNAGKQCVAVDFGTPAGIARLRRLITWADIVIDASRPRGLPVIQSKMLRAAVLLHSVAAVVLSSSIGGLPLAVPATAVHNASMPA